MKGDDKKNTIYILANGNSSVNLSLTSITRTYKRFSLSIKSTLYLEIKIWDFYIISRIVSTIIADPLALKGIVFLTISPNVSLAYFLL